MFDLPFDFFSLAVAIVGLSMRTHGNRSVRISSVLKASVGSKAQFSGSGGTGSLFFWAAEINGLSLMSITGNNGADGQGTQDTYSFTASANGVTYTAFLKRVYNASDPSINQLFLIPQPNSASQTIGVTTDDSQQIISGLTGVTRVYYMLYAGASGAFIDNITISKLPLAPPAVTISRSGSNVTLDWTADANATGYEVWWGINDPYFTPGTSCPGTNCAVVATPPYPHNNPVSTTDNYTYVVRAVKGNIKSQPTNRVSEFDFALVR